MIEQLYYTSSPIGFSGSSGFQVRAASKGLQNLQSTRFNAIDPYLRYQLPPGASPYNTSPHEAPICLAFLETSTQEKILLQKVGGLRDERNRPGNYFVHLLAGVPATFSARDAIQLWRSPFWKSSDNELSSQQRDLPLVSDHELVASSFNPAHLQHIERYLPFVIQAFLTLEPSQQLFIAAHPDMAATLIWALTRCLPVGILQNLTFSTYEAEPLSGTSRIVATSWLTSQIQGHENDPKFDLPAACYQAKGLAINCYSGRSSGSGLADNTREAHFARFATQDFIKHNSRALDDLLAKAERMNITDVKGFLLVYYFYTVGTEGRLAPVDMAYLLENKRLASEFLSEARIQEQLIELVMTKSNWWTHQARMAIKGLRAEAKRQPTSILATSLQQLVNQAIIVAKEQLLDQNLDTAKLLLDGLATNATNEEPLIWSNLLNQLTQHPPNRYDWQIRQWLLNKWGNMPSIHSKQFMASLTPWLDVSWQELPYLLNQSIPLRWQQIAVNQSLIRYQNEAHSLPRSMVGVVESHHQLFMPALQNLVHSDNHNNWSVAIRFFSDLVKHGYPHKRDLLKILLSGPSDIGYLESTLQAAQLKPEETPSLLEKVASGYLLNLPNLPPTLIQLLDQYMDNFRTADCERESAKLLLQRLPSLSDANFSQDRRQAAHSWLTICHIVKRPQIILENLTYITRVARSISVLQPEQQEDFFYYYAQRLAPFINQYQQIETIHSYTSNINKKLFWRLFYYLVAFSRDEYADNAQMLLPYICFLLGYKHNMTEKNRQDYINQLIKHPNKETIKNIDSLMKQGRLSVGIRERWKRYSADLRSPSLRSRIWNGLKSFMCSG